MNNIKTHCGLFAVCSSEKGEGAVYYVQKGLKKLQHRGQEGAGICYEKKNEIKLVSGEGLVDNAIPTVPFGKSLAMGHVRYSTSRSNKGSLNEVQPLIGKSEKGIFAVCHNGNIPIQNRKDSFDYENDTMYLVRYISNKLNEKTMLEVLSDLVREIQSAYCLMVMFNNKLYLVRDKHGVRPLIIGIGNLGVKHSLWVSSESCAFPEWVRIARDVNPGEVICMNNGLWESYQVSEIKPAICIFEYVYFLRENSIVNNVLVRNAREKMGSFLCEQDIKEKTLPPEDSIVVGAPNSGISAGMAYAKRNNFEYKQILTRKVKKRTFIEKSQRHRIDAVRRKFSVSDDLKGKSIVFVDDSLVRGNTVKGIINMLKEVGVKEVHIRIASPPVKNECYFGIDIPDKKDLIAINKSIDQIRKEVGADSLKYLNEEDTITSVKTSNLKYDKMCTGCFNNKYEGLLSW